MAMKCMKYIEKFCQQYKLTSDEPNEVEQKQNYGKAFGVKWRK